MNLDRDDRGQINDEMIVDGQRVSNDINQEVVTLRGRAPGEYIANLQYYASETKRPIGVDVTVTRVNPRLQIVFEDRVRLEHVGDEHTAVRFTVRDDGSVGNINTLPMTIAR